MRIIIAGSRSAPHEQVNRAIDRCPWIGFASEVVSGTANGADQAGEKWAEQHGVRVHQMPADWSEHGKRAGPLRNEAMADLAQGLIAVWDGRSAGTRHMIEIARKRGLRIFVYLFASQRLEHVEASEGIADLWEAATERAAMKQYAGDTDQRTSEREAGAEALAAWLSARQG
jgi:hypothetical protein